MDDKRYICEYPQYTYCGKEQCSLAHKCRKFPMYNHSLKYDLCNKLKNKVSKTYNEKLSHAKQYQFYNCLWGKAKEYRKEYNKRYYQLHREEILAKKRKSYSDRILKVQRCKYECERCPYPDCTLPDIETRKQYMDLYYRVFHEELLQKKAEYRQSNRRYLANKEKLRNYGDSVK